VLSDFAEDATTFDEFKKEVVRFFESTDDDTVSEWLESVKGVQEGKIVAPGELPVGSAAASALSVEVTQKPIEQVTAQDNAAGVDYALAAAA
jgi:hypothetical protein